MNNVIKKLIFLVGISLHCVTQLCAMEKLKEMMADFQHVSIEEKAKKIAELEQKIANPANNEQQKRAFALELEEYKKSFERANKVTEQYQQIIVQTAQQEMLANIEIGKQKANVNAIFKGLMEPKLWLGVSAISAAGIFSYYTFKLAYEQVKKRLGIPKLIDETSRKTPINSFIHLFKNEVIAKTVKPTDEVILSAELAAIAEQLAQDTQEIRNYRLPYQNLLLYGPPGTGKTEFAKLLALYSGMDYAILSASRFAQFEPEKAIIELFHLFEWAEVNKRGTIIFIDEADACFRDRATLDANGIKFLEAFLSKTGKSSPDFMFVFATNYEDELDQALLSRVHQKINFPLPALPERKKILQQKIDKYILNDKHTYKDKNGLLVTKTLSLDDDITEQFIHDLAVKMDGFSGRDIDYTVAQMRLKAYQSGMNMLTKEMVMKIVAQKIKEVEKDRKTAEYQKNRLQKRADAAAH